MTQSPPPATGAAAAYRDTLDAAIDAIRPFAVQGEARQYQRSLLDTVTYPLRHPIATLRGDADSMEGEINLPVDEAAMFGGLAKALDDFGAAFAGITFDDGAQQNAERVKTTTTALAAVAHRHAVTRDPADPATDKTAAKEFHEAMSAWEDATADLATDLDL